ncbi:response regulator transcription factor [Coleofasciculus sp. FACHB-712]|uniref:response regulator n=1 Tax=Cyanophyceae TaxID=3028117 RepID=UPI0016868515|nr:response regulator transcription factor [Coleofasciculus sp. FACHB-712]MBD1945659.1 response regulator transcription factor [Coleofasciculus sp. FACHB-712]
MASESASPLSTLRMIIVEDDPLMQLGLEQALANYPQYELVEQAEDGYLGVEAAKRLKPDLVVMDIGLPRLDGIAATQQIKDALPEVRVVILTSHTLETEIIASLSAGADAYCVKGASIDRLLIAITAASEGATYLDPQIAQLVLTNLKPFTPSTAIGNLSTREIDVLKRIVQGKSNNEIAEELYLSPNTIKTYVRGIMNKLAVDDRVQAAVVALRSGLV